LTMTLTLLGSMLPQNVHSSATADDPGAVRIDIGRDGGDGKKVRPASDRIAVLARAKCVLAEDVKRNLLN